MVLNIRQIGNYPTRTASDGHELILVQPGGLGGPYQSIDAATLVSTALIDASLGVGQSVPQMAVGGQVFASELVLPKDGNLLFNAYADPQWNLRYWFSGAAGQFSWDAQGGFSWLYAPAGQAWTRVAGLTDLMQLSPSGALRLAGTLTVARDPGSAMEVATMGWVGANTVASFMGRRGPVQLFSDDVYRALGLEPDSLATTGSVQWAIGEMLRTHPFVWSWNGRCGNVWLTEDDTNAVMTAAGAAPLASLAPPGDSSARIANTAWVSRLVYGKFWSELGKTFAPIASPAFIGKPTAPEPPQGSDDNTLATTAWVRSVLDIEAAGVLSFNARTGLVTLELADIMAAGGAPLDSPSFVGVPLVPTAPATAMAGEVANAAWVNAAILAGTVTSFNTRTGPVTLGLADIRSADGQRVTVCAATPPANPGAGDLWWNSADPTGGDLFVWYVDGAPGQWVQASGGEPGPAGPLGPAGPPGAGLKPLGTVADHAALLALPGPHAVGDLWVTDDNHESFAWDGTAFISLGMIGQGFSDAPSDNSLYGRRNNTWVALIDDGVY